jgi:hypothetical protein
MSEPADGATPSRAAWQPFTFSGLAAFARGGLGRLALAELIFAALVSISVVSFLHHDYSPVVAQAIHEMPETAKITSGHLTGCDETLIADTKFLAIAVSPDLSGQIGQSADIQIQFRPDDFRIGTVFRPDWGFEFDYGPDTTIDLSRSSLEPWWGAWHPILLAAAGMAVLVSLFIMWALLAVIYTVPAKIIACFGDRELSWKGAWRLGSAAQLPGSFLMAAAIFLYGRQGLDLIGLGFSLVAHLLVDWIYLVGGVWLCPRLARVLPKQNPFIT